MIIRTISLMAKALIITTIGHFKKVITMITKSMVVVVFLGKTEAFLKEISFRTA